MRKRQLDSLTASGILLGGLLCFAGAAAAQSPSVMAGEKLAFDRSKGNCLTCHDIKGGDAPGNVGPPLSNMKARFPDRKQLAAIIYDETKRNPQIRDAAIRAQSHSYRSGNERRRRLSLHALGAQLRNGF